MTDYEEIMTDDEFFEEKPEEDKATFKVDSDEIAEWALKKIKNETEEHDRLVSLAEAEIKGYKDKIELLDYQLSRKTAYLKQKLFEYFNKVQHKSTKTTESYKLLSGTLTLKLPSQKMVKNDEKLAEFLEGYAPEYVETIKKPKWGEFKKELSIQGNQVINNQTGEVISADIVSVEDVPGEFGIKL